MIKKLSLGLLAMSFFMLAQAQVSIYDIQYTTDEGNGTYPSKYDGQVVTTGGIVTGIEYSGTRYFISSSKGGAWNGVFIYDKNYSPSLGDSILITGEVMEYKGYTEIKSLSSYSVKSTGNALPEPAIVSVSQIGDEAYEGVLVAIKNVEVYEGYDRNGIWLVEDASGVDEVVNSFFQMNSNHFPLMKDYPLEMVRGLVGIGSSGVKLNPRNQDDVKSTKDAFVTFTGDKQVDLNKKFTIPVQLGLLNQSMDLNSYQLNISYNAQNFRFDGFSKEGSISESGNLTNSSIDGKVILEYNGATTCTNTENLINLQFTSLQEGKAELNFTSTKLNGKAVSFFQTGNLECLSTDCDIPQADTLTVVQRPLLNIPSMILEQEEFNIVCFAPEATKDWQAELLYGDLIVPIEMKTSSYDSQLDKWTLKASVPNVDVYELYDLRLTASGGIVDTVHNAVKLLDKYRDSYYFVHITDTHLPGHSFYGTEGYATDYSELEDLEEVIKDINIIRPEFVLLTGDLINEGELEDFECLRNHSLSIRLLEKLEVPVYLVPGNHDLGGWTATPPAQGTSRRDWWRFFGWRQREIPPVQTEYLTHDYSFDYGNTHFTGLEAYDNYDEYMFDTYGKLSFIPSQIEWLKQDLAAAGNKKKVLFYHYDFKHELDLYALGVDMALWGHNHKNTGDVNAKPISLSTASTCDEKRTFRVLRVENGELSAEEAVRTHDNGDMLSLFFNTANDGTLDRQSATIDNKYDLKFQHALVKFIMPKSDKGYTVSNGKLIQTLEENGKVTCYVELSISAKSTVNVSIEKATETSTAFEEGRGLNLKVYPNPFDQELNFTYDLEQKSSVKISLFDMEGKLVRILVDAVQYPAEYTSTWDGKNVQGTKMNPATYMYRFSLNGKEIKTGKLVYVG